VDHDERCCRASRRLSPRRRTTGRRGVRSGELSQLVSKRTSSPSADAGGVQGDREFLARALGVNQLEIDLGRLAGRAGTDDVKTMGEKMIQNHTALGRQLGALAEQSGAPVRAETSPEDRQVLARMESLSGGAFDAAFKETVDATHVKELAMYDDEVARAANPQLRALAEQRVATLRRVVADAEQAKRGK
jgi:putative membrane protein